MSWFRKFPAAAAVCLLALTSAGCEVENLTALGLDDTNPLRLVRGAAYTMEFFAVQYGNIITGATGETGSGAVSDPTAVRFFERNFTDLHHARVLAAMAIQRSEELGVDSVIGLAHLWHGWINIRLAEIWGDQPLGDGIVHPAEELFQTALANFEVASNDPVDSVRLASIAGIARAHWRLGLAPVDPGHLNAAIAAADRVLAEAPTLKFAPLPKRPNYLTNRTGAPGFENIPRWWMDPAETGVTLITADELRLIKAEAYLLLGQLDDAKAAVKSTHLLPVNHVGLAGRDHAGAPLSQSEVDAYIDPMDAEQLMHVIDELRRELFYGQGRRDVGPNDDGTMFPLQYPPNG